MTMMLIFYNPLAITNENSVKINPNYFALSNDLEEFNTFPWGVHSWEATSAAIRNTVENKMSSKRRLLKKTAKVHYSITSSSCLTRLGI